MVIDDFSGCMSRTAIISHLKNKKFLPPDENLSMRAFASQKQTPLALLIWSLAYAVGKLIIPSRSEKSSVCTRRVTML
jgi:hypothetical protein